MFLFALVVGAIVGWGVYSALLNGGWTSQNSSLGGVLGFFATVLIFYRLIFVTISR
jgi:hypothetical protein